MSDLLSDIEVLEQRVRNLPQQASVGVLGRSLLGREIPIITLGQGKRAVLYVAAQSGTEHVMTEVLLDFISDYLACLERRATQYTYPLERLYRDCCIYIVPMLNPDGISYVLHGPGANNPIRERVLAMNGKEEFSTWEANARGVDLRCNYNAGFSARKEREYAKGMLCGAPRGYSGEYPESEPETSAICQLLRLKRQDIRGVLDLRLGGERILCGCEDNLSAKSMSVGRVLARMTGYRLERPEQLRITGDLTDWCIRSLGRPAYVLMCGKENEKNTAPRVPLYGALRRVLFSFPYLL